MDKDLNKLLSRLQVASEKASSPATTTKSKTSSDSSSFKPDPSFQTELNKTSFQVFQCVSDLGYFKWIANKAKAKSSISKVSSAKEIKDQIDLAGKPDPMVELSSIRRLLPMTFARLSPQEAPNSYPYGQLDIASLHVASQHRGLDLEEVDFCFGGSTLDVLANKVVPSSSPSTTRYIAVVVPHTRNTILVCKRKDYTYDFSAPGFQFERLMTGNKFTDPHKIEFVESMQVLKIVGPDEEFKVLLRAEIDASYEGSSVELTTGNPRYWGTDKVFQMISNGSPNLCAGSKQRGVLTGVDIKKLSTLARDIINVTKLEQNILDCMKSLKKEISKFEVGAATEIYFDSGSLKLRPAHGVHVLPPANIVKDLVNS